MRRSERAAAGCASVRSGDSCLIDCACCERWLERADVAEDGPTSLPKQYLQGLCVRDSMRVEAGHMSVLQSHGTARKDASSITLSTRLPNVAVS